MAWFSEFIKLSIFGITLGVIFIAPFVLICHSWEVCAQLEYEANLYQAGKAYEAAIYTANASYNEAAIKAEAMVWVAEALLTKGGKDGLKRMLRSFRK